MSDMKAETKSDAELREIVNAGKACMAAPVSQHAVIPESLALVAVVDCAELAEEVLALRAKVDAMDAERERELNNFMEDCREMETILATLSRHVRALHAAHKDGLEANARERLSRLRHAPRRAAEAMRAKCAREVEVHLAYVDSEDERHNFGNRVLRDIRALDVDAVLAGSSAGCDCNGAPRRWEPGCPPVTEGK